MPRGKPADLKLLAQVGALGGIAAIAAERQRQATEYQLDYGRIKGYSAEHDDEHTDNSLALAAATYAMPYPYKAGFRDRLWPKDWGELPSPASADNHNLRKRELEKAGALCAAEIDRLVRLQAEGVAIV